MQSVWVTLYIMAVGFVSAGILSSFVQWISGKPARFELAPETFLASLVGVALGAVAGPAILMRNAWWGLKLQDRPPFWFGLSAILAGVWSLFSGTILLAIVFAV
ncbi:hypothetical protein V6C03_13000 [Methyloligella sp. 2.7D]|uniref:DUF6949 family protein n=1 Tax=unclassified Methyloligella TaxID=2625955 RepID=UPI00157BB819|nr:hypothetical protein [Methyloligella sp. GL2]QKP77301.1 hypothetical protein HT051_07460 [Methyloligella sp. GL2]